ncbi:MAG TPA: SH3 domain-containing protein [Verrucomicrobiae bacterium]|jgi:outer membrane biosynthesis protein TonB|nr:SH3 domain-containing protein [Verrucomicrobiae bacterium]
MKTIWTILGTLMAASLFAQNNPNTLPPVPPPVNAPAAETAPAAPAPAPPKKTIKKHHLIKHKAAGKEAPAGKEEPTVTLGPGPAQVGASDLVVRGQAGLKGEVVAHLTKGETVNVLEQINLQHHTAGEPAQWAKISYPTNGHVWIMSKFVKDGTVSTKKLNLRAGPGENYSVVGVIDQGAPVNEIESKGGWMKIAPPAGAYAFVAAKYLTQEAMPPVAMNSNPETPEVAPTPTQVQPQQQVVNVPPPAPAPPTPPQPPQPTVRIVQHEGVIGPVGSVIAPTAYKLYDPKTGLDIDFLYPTSPDQDLHKLVDDRVIVSGEEGVDTRWPNTPVIAIQNIEILGKNVIKRLDLTPPKQRH